MRVLRGYLGAALGLPIMLALVWALLGTAACLTTFAISLE
jgi:hypothetical protein